MARKQFCGILTRLAAAAFFVPAVWGQSIITTVAGTEWLFNGDGRPAVNAPLGEVIGLAVDRTGRVVFADRFNHMVMRVETDGTITVLAGNGLPGYSGDGFQAVDASLNTPSGVALDSQGNIYIADLGNNRIRRIGTNGIITTVAGTGQAGAAGDGGPAVFAQLNLPLAVAVDSAGVLYINDTANRLIRRVDANGVITTFAGVLRTSSGACADGRASATPIGSQFQGVEAIAVDSNRNLLIADFGANCIRRVTPDGNMTRIAGAANGVNGFSPDGARAVNAQLNGPGGVAADAFGNIFIVDTNNQVVRRINTDGVLTTVAGAPGRKGGVADGAAPLSATFANPFGVAVDSSGTLYIADRDNFRVRRITASAVNTVAGNGAFQRFPDGTPAANAFLQQPSGVYVDAQRNVWIADAQNNRVRRIAPDGRMFTVAGNGAREYSGDNGAALNAGLASPIATVVDAAGNLYIADTDNNRIRRVTPGGVITTFAGTGQIGLGGENVPASSTPLIQPKGLAIDAAGNIYVSEGCVQPCSGIPDVQRIRRITPSGQITTFAGTTRGFSGDGGPGASAQFSVPFGLAFDRSGNLLVADYVNGRVRRISSAGVVSTIAGGGTRQGLAAGSWPALEARLSLPAGVVADTGGNVYFTELSQNLVRRIGTDGRLATVAGTTVKGFAGDGGAATQALLAFPMGIAIDPAGNVLIADRDNNRIRAVQALAPSFDVGPATLTLTGSSTGAIPEAEIVSVTPSVTGLRYTTTITEGREWLKLENTEGVMPAAIKVTGDPAALRAGNFRGVIRVDSPGANPGSRTVTVTFNVAAPPTPKLVIDRVNLVYPYAEGSTPVTQQVRVTNAGGGSLDYAVKPETVTSAGWLSVSGGGSPATPTAPGQLTVTANPEGLAPGTYTGSVTITPAAGESVKVPVTMTIAESRPRFVVSQSGLRFTAAQGGTPLPQTFGVLNGGSGTLSYTVETSTLGGGEEWLRVAPRQGAVESSRTEAPTLTVSVNPAGLAPADYYGQVRLNDPNAVNSPQIIPVVLKVLAAGTNPGPEVGQSSLVFAAPAGSSPGSQTILLANPGRTALTYSSTRTTTDGRNWFIAAPVNGTLQPNELARIVVQPDFAGLEAGARQGKLTLSFSDGSVRSVDILGLATAGALDGKEPGRYVVADCRVDRLLPQFSTPVDNTAAVTLQPVPLRVKIFDNCGGQITGRDADVFATFSNRDADVNLTSTGGGEFSGTWQPRNATQQRVEVRVSAITTRPGQILLGQATRSLRLSASGGAGDPPVVTRGAIQNAATLEDSTVVAPGGLITIRGKGFAESQINTAALPLPLETEGTEVYLQGRRLPLLFTSDGQINAQVPYDVTPNAPQQLLVRRKSTLSLDPEVLTVAPATPGVLTVNQQGTGQGFIYVIGGDGADTLADESAPAWAGARIRILAAGLGKTSPEVPAGVQPPSDPRAVVVNPVFVTIGGVPAAVEGATLRPDPDLPGRYEVVAVVPDGVAPGGAVPVTITVAGQTSQAATMAIR